MVKPRIQEIADRVREELGEDASLIPEKKSADESIYDEYDSLYDLVKDVFGEEILEYIGDKVFAYEIEQQRALRENENYEAAIIRQAAFIETALQSNIQTEWEKNRKKNKFDKEISRAEERYLDYLRNNSTGSVEILRELQVRLVV